MFLENSRYHNVPQDTAPDATGRSLPVLRLRRLPPVTGAPVTVKDNDRLDIIAFRRYGDSTRFWHVADANTELQASDLTAETGRVINVPEK